MSTVQSAAARVTPRQAIQRFWEVDSLRGVAIVMMVIFHLMWDLWYFRVLPDVVLWAGFWKYFQRTTAILFILLVGVSLTISYQRSVAKRGVDGLYLKFLVRGLRIFGLGMVITVVTAALRIGYVHFGVLHLIGFSIAVAYPFLRYRRLNLALWAAFVVAGYFVRYQYVDTLWLVWLGLTPRLYAPNDFFPLIPWFGVVLLGVFLGNTFYPQGKRTFFLPDFSAWLPFRFLEFLGRHSLLIYMVHQPALFALLALFGIIDIGL